MYSCSLEAFIMFSLRLIYMCAHTLDHVSPQNFRQCLPHLLTALFSVQRLTALLWAPISHGCCKMFICIQRNHLCSCAAPGGLSFAGLPEMSGILMLIFSRLPPGAVVKPITQTAAADSVCFTQILLAISSVPAKH